LQEFSCVQRNKKKTAETAKKAILSPVRLPFRHTGGVFRMKLVRPNLSEKFNLPLPG
jgi:hypothetical protein